MAGITTSMLNSFRQEMFQSGHCFQATLTQTGNTINTNNLINQLTSTANLVVGMSVSGTNIPSNTFIGYIVNSTAVVVSNNSTGAGQPSITFTGDTFKIALIKFGMTGTYDKTTSNYANVTSNSDEVSGTGYSAGGLALSLNINPSVPDSNTAITSWTVNPSWTSATIDAAGCIIYNATSPGRIGTTTNRGTSVHDFGGEQKVTSGTFTVNFPTANGTAAILRLA